MMYKRAVVLVYHDINFECRSQEYLRLAEKMCENVVLVCLNPLWIQSKAFVISAKQGQLKYLSFVIKSKEALKKYRPDIVFLHDSESTVLTRYVRKYCPDAKVVFDSSELYYDRKFPTFKSRLAHGLWEGCQKKYIASYDVVMAANIERAELMKEHYGLREQPIVFDNIHRIDDAYNLQECESKFANCIDSSKCNILYAGGVSEERRTFELAEIVSNNASRYNILICSGVRVPEYNMNRLRSYMDKGNVRFLGRLSRAELKYILERVHVSVSVFEQNCLNNRYCASGKVYESLFCGVPVLLSDNPPLKRICDDYHIGVATDNLEAGLKELSNNIDAYRANVARYVATIEYDNRVDHLYSAVKERLL